MSRRRADNGAAEFGEIDRGPRGSVTGALGGGEENFAAW